MRWKDLTPAAEHLSVGLRGIFTRRTDLHRETVCRCQLIQRSGHLAHAIRSLMKNGVQVDLGILVRQQERKMEAI